MADLTKYEELEESVEGSSCEAEEKDKIVFEKPPLERVVSEIAMKGTNWPSLTIAFIILLLVGIQFSVYMSSLWPYLQKVRVLLSCSVLFPVPCLLSFDFRLISLLMKPSSAGS